MYTGCVGIGGSAAKDEGVDLLGQRVVDLNRGFGIGRLERGVDGAGQRFGGMGTGVWVQGYGYRGMGTEVH